MSHAEVIREVAWRLAGARLPADRPAPAEMLLLSRVADGAYPFRMGRVSSDPEALRSVLEREGLSGVEDVAGAARRPPGAAAMSDSFKAGEAARPAPTPPSAQLETLHEAIARLAGAGFRDSFQAVRGGLRALDAKQVIASEQLVVEEIVRFEGESDPGDAAVLFALRSHDGKIAGTFVASYGPATDAEAARVMQALEAAHAERTRARERDG